MSPICLGMMSYGDKIRRAWFLSEEITGRLLSRLFADRDRGLSRKHVMSAVDASLQAAVTFPCGCR